MRSHNNFKKYYNSNNEIVILDNGVPRHARKNDLSGLNISLGGHNNKIYIEYPNSFENCDIRLDGDNNLIEIKSSTIGFRNLEILMLAWGNNRKLTFGRDCSCESLSIFHHESDSNLIIGNNVMFARDCTIQATDSHAILDKDTHKLVNNGPHTVAIGDNVWVAQGASILKNAKIPSNTVVATGAIVTSVFNDENTVIGGMPAHVLKRNIVWRRNQINAIVNMANEFPINPADITFVVQGAIDKTWTTKCLDSIRRFFPASHVILSTWVGANVNDIKYLCDEIIFNDDPGTVSFSESVSTAFNLNRQIASTLAGLRAVRTKYAVKMRTDMVINGYGFVKYFDKFKEYDKKYKLFSQRIVSFAGYKSYTPDGHRAWDFCMHDYGYFGLTSDLLKLWDIPLMDDDCNYYWRHRKYKYPKLTDKHAYFVHNTVLRKPHYRYHAEQYVLLYAFKKLRGIKIKMDNMFDFSDENIELFTRLLVNNFIPLYPTRLGMSLPRESFEYTTDGYTSPLDYTYPEFLKLYNEYANGHADIPESDTERARWSNKNTSKHNKPLLYRILHFYWLRGKK